MNIAVLVQAIATFSIIGTIGLIAVVIVMGMRGKSNKNMTRLLVVAIVVAVVFSTVAAGLVFIQPEQRGVVVSALTPTGYRDQTLNPGLHWVVPFAENVILYPISRQTYTMSVAPAEGQVYGDDSIRARTKDGQEVFIDASVIYSINPSEIIALHINWQSRYQDEVVRPLARGIIRDIASQYGIEEIVSSQRIAMVEAITSTMATKLAENNLVLVDFILRDIHFSDAYAQAVEQKQIAEQQAQQAAYIVDQRRQEAEQARQVAQGQADSVVIQAQGAADARLIQAEAEAQALEMIAAALQNNPDLLTYTYIQKIAPNVQIMLVPTDNPFILPLPGAQ